MAITEYSFSENVLPDPAVIRNRPFIWCSQPSKQEGLVTYIGVDLHKEQFTVCYRVTEGNETIREFDNGEEGISDFKQTLSCLDMVAVEAVGRARYFVKQIAPLVRKVVLVTPWKYAILTTSIKKTDANDARVLALGLEKDILPVARLRTEAAHQVRALLNARELLVAHRVRLMNVMESIVANYGIKIPKLKLRYRNWRESVDVNQFAFGEYHAWLTLNDQMEAANSQIVNLERQIVDSSKQFESYGVLASVPGFGPITVAHLLRTIDRIADFNNPKALCSFLGIVPRTRQSAGHNLPSRKAGRYKSGAITRAGDSKTRSALIMAVNRVLVHNQSLRNFYDRVKGRRGYRKARTAAARKLLTFLYFALKKGKPIEAFEKIDFSKPHSAI